MDEILEKFSRAIDPQAWGDNVTPTRGGVLGMHAARQRANEAAQRVIDSVSLADLDALKELFP
jgi:hypothetical protein